MSKKTLFKNMMLSGLVVVPLVGVNAQAQDLLNYNASLAISADMCDNLVIPPPTNTWVYCVFETEDDVDTFSVPAGAGPGCFQIVDAFIPGDVYDVTRVENGKSFTTWRPFDDNPYGDEYYGGQGGLSASSHTLEASVNPENTGIFPAGYYVRFVPQDPPCKPMEVQQLLEIRNADVFVNMGTDNEDIPGVANDVKPGAIVIDTNPDD